ncbi:hypothetical protein SAMN02194393_01527 [Maledivibacter halophilus]|uniref:Uncharacterized protein n=2 Tax=Maledivibacter halophilus TaxID=36842 RepID=A0A1T5K0D0_9FIRM|nr:hypothetical protein SAMN02194393_01527 [Maledivibacter halophilus]
MSEDYYDEEYLKENLYDEISNEEIAASQANNTASYDENFILQKLMEGISREELAKELDHKSYRTLDMYMRRRGYKWDNYKQIYILKSQSNIPSVHSSSTSKVQRILSLFKADIDPKEVAKRVGLKDHRTMAAYMKSKGYIWSSEDQNYTLLKGPISSGENQDSANSSQTTGENHEHNNKDYIEEKRIDASSEGNLSKLDRLNRLIPMLEMIERNKDKLTQLLAINDGGTIPRYVVGGITITKSLCMSHSLSELVKEFSKEKNISQKEIFEVAIIEFLEKYGYENEINALFT